MKILLVLAMLFMFYLIIGLITLVGFLKSILEALNEINTKYDLKIYTLDLICMSAIIKSVITDIRILVLWPIYLCTFVKNYTKSLPDELFEGIKKGEV